MTRWRPFALVAGIAFVAWVGFEVARAGSDVPPPAPQGPAQLRRGAISGKRLDGRGWSLDYETQTISQDGVTVTLQGVRDGRIFRPGKPDVHLSAQNVVVNAITSDVTVTGPVSFREPVGARTRTIATTGARYAGISRVLTLDRPTTITDGTNTLTVDSAKIDFRSGDMQIGRIAGSGSGSVR